MSNRMPAAPRSRLIENSRIFAGEKDFNRPNTRAAYEQGFKKEGFSNVKLFP